jgi:hypothetical protein
MMPHFTIDIVIFLVRKWNEKNGVVATFYKFDIKATSCEELCPIPNHFSHVSKAKTFFDPLFVSAHIFGKRTIGYNE